MKKDLYIKMLEDEVSELQRQRVSKKMLFVVLWVIIWMIVSVILCYNYEKEEIVEEERKWLDYTCLWDSWCYYFDWRPRYERCEKVD